MSPQKRRPQARKGRTAAAARQGGRKTDRTALIAAVVIVVVGVSLVFAFASAASKKHNQLTGDSKAPASLVKKVTGVPDSVISSVGQGTSSPLPAKLHGTTLVKNGKPLIVYVGAEYCPYCATERWPMVNAFSRFGTFKNLQITTSADSPEVFPNTSTFSFHGATYSSDYIVFQTVEGKDRASNPLETTTPQQSQLFAKYDSPPYIDKAHAGAIPFIDFANQYLISGATYSPSVLTGLTHDNIASSLSDGNSSVSKGVVGAANTITAAVCSLTNDKPANVCSVPAIQTIEASIKAQK